MEFKFMYSSRDIVEGRLSDGCFVRISEIAYISTGFSMMELVKDDDGRFLRDKKGCPIVGREIIYYVVRTKNGENYFCDDGKFIMDLVSCGNTYDGEHF